MSTKAIQTAYFATGASQVVQWVKNSPTMQETQETQVQSLGQEDPLKEDMATHSSILAWRIRMDRGAWWITVHGVTELDTTEATYHAHMLMGDSDSALKTLRGAVSSAFGMVIDRKVSPEELTFES